MKYVVVKNMIKYMAILKEILYQTVVISMLSTAEFDLEFVQNI